MERELQLEELLLNKFFDLFGKQVQNHVSLNETDISDMINVLVFNDPKGNSRTLKIKNRDYPREHIVLYILSAIDTVFDIIDQCSLEVRCYLKDAVFDFCEKYSFVKKEIRKVGTQGDKL